MARITLSDEATEILVEAIVNRAADDYRRGREGLRTKGLTEVRKLYYTRLVEETETFFKSQWFYMMGGSEAMWKQLKRECDCGYFRTWGWKE